MLSLCEEVSLSLSAFVPFLYLRIDPSIFSRSSSRSLVGAPFPLPPSNQIPCSGPSAQPPGLVPRNFLDPRTPELLLSLSRKLGTIFIDESLRATAARRAPLLAWSSTSNCLKKERKKKKKMAAKRKKESRQREVGKVLFRSLTGQVASTSIDSSRSA